MEVNSRHLKYRKCGIYHSFLNQNDKCLIVQDTVQNNFITKTHSTH